MTYKHFVAMFIAGGIGALSRYGLSAFVSRLVGPFFPWGTLVVNLFGCFVFGFLLELISIKMFSPQIRVIVLTGFVGSFTTFSAWIYDCWLLGHTRAELAGLNMLGQIVFGGICLYLGLRAGQLWR